MNEKNAKILELYDVCVSKIVRGRGSLICYTDKGIKQLVEYKGSNNKMEDIYKLLTVIKDFPDIKVDCPNKSIKDELVVSDDEEIKYVLKDYYNGRDCDVKCEEDIYSAAYYLGRLHRVLNIIDIRINTCLYKEESIIDENKRHNKEIIRVKNYIRDKKTKNVFEYEILKKINHMLDISSYAIDRMVSSKYSIIKEEAIKKTRVCHGEYSYHSISFIQDIDNIKEAFIKDFEHIRIDTQISDLYYFFRKVMEKYEWDIKVADNLLKSYLNCNSISEEEIKTLGIMLLYPEKYWKILNYYLNKNKAWVPEKSMEKLELVYNQEDKKLNLIRSIFDIY